MDNYGQPFFPLSCPVGQPFVVIHRVDRFRLELVKVELVRVPGHPLLEFRVFLYLRSHRDRCYKSDKMDKNR